MKRYRILCIMLCLSLAFASVVCGESEFDYKIQPPVIEKITDGGYEPADCVTEGKYRASAEFDAYVDDSLMLFFALYDGSDMLLLDFDRKNVKVGERVCFEAEIDVTTAGAAYSLETAVVSLTDGFCLLSEKTSLYSDTDSSKEITGFWIEDGEKRYSAQIDSENKRIIMYLPKGMTSVELSPQISVSGGASVYPPSGTARDFSKKQKYKVTANDKSTVFYTVEVYECIENQSFSTAEIGELEGWSLSAAAGEVSVRCENENGFAVINDSSESARSFLRYTFNPISVNSELVVKFRMKTENALDKPLSAAECAVQIYSGAKADICSLIPVFLYKNSNSLALGYRKDFNSQLIYGEEAFDFSCDMWHDIELHCSYDAEKNNVGLWVDGEYIGMGGVIFSGLSEPVETFSRVTFITGNKTLGCLSIDDVAIYNKCSDETEETEEPPIVIPDNMQITLNDPIISSDLITFSGKITGGSGIPVIVTVKNPRGISGEDNGIRYIKQILSKDGGEYEISFKIRGDEAVGTYEVTANSINCPQWAVCDYFYITEQASETILDNLDACGDKNEIFDLINKEWDFLNYIGVRIDLYNGLQSGEERLDVCSRILNREEDYTSQNIAAIMNEIIALKTLNCANPGEFADKASDCAELLGINLYEDIYKELSPDELGIVLSTAYKKIPFAEASCFEENIRTAALITILNRSTWSEIKKITEENNDVFGLNFTGDYRQAAAAGKEGEVFSSLIGKNFMSIDSIREAFNKAVLNAVIVSGATGSGEGSGGSSGRSIGASSGATANIAVEENNNFFSDLKDYEWAEESINYLYKRGILNGVGGDRFEPGRSISRAEFVKLLCMNADVDTEGLNCPFKDVAVSDWFYESVMKAVISGLVQGKTTDLFEPDAYITREEAAAVVERLLTNEPTWNTEEKPFADSGDIDAFAMSAVLKLKGMGVITGAGNNRFEPKRSIQRAEAAVIICRALQIAQ